MILSKNFNSTPINYKKLDKLEIKNPIENKIIVANDLYSKFKHSNEISEYVGDILRISKDNEDIIVFMGLWCENNLNYDIYRTNNLLKLFDGQDKKELILKILFKENENLNVELLLKYINKVSNVYDKYRNESLKDLIAFYFCESLPKDRKKLYECLFNEDKVRQEYFMDLLIENGLTDFALYEEIRNKKIDRTMVCKIFSFEKNVDYLKIFENTLKKTFDNGVPSVNFFNFNNLENDKFNYIVDEFIIKYDYVDTFVNFQLINNMKLKDKGNFNRLIDNLIKKDIEKKILSAEMIVCCLYRSINYGNKDACDKIMNYQKNERKDLEKDVHKMLISNESINIKRELTNIQIKNTNEEFVKFRKEYFKSYLEDNIEIRNEERKTNKI